MNFITRFLIKRAGFVVLFGLLAGAWGAKYSVHLFSNLRTEIEELLPTDARSVQDLNEVRARLESTNNINVLVMSDHVKESKQFVIDLANAAEKLPKEVAAGVEYRINKELAFFNGRKSLFIEEDDLGRIKKFIQDKIDYEKQLYNPLTIIENRSFNEPRLDLKALQKKYTGRVDGYTRFPDGFYATPDEKTRVLIVNLPGGSGGIEGAKKLRKSLDDTIANLHPEKYAPDLKIHFSGGVQDLIEEHEALIEDLALSTIVVCVLVGIAMILYFKTIMGTFALILSLLVGVLLTFGVAFFEVGYLNANSAFMGSIVIGNGINFGIILLARFIEERQKHKSVPHCVALAVERTFPATAVAALAAGLSYGSLMLTSFRGFRQFGVIGLTGMVICWTLSYLLIPSLIILFYRIGLFRKPMHKSNPWFAGAIAGMVRRFPKPILLLTAVISILSITTLGRIDSSIIETDLKKLRNKHSLENGSMYWSKYVDEVFQRYLSPVVILPHNSEDVHKIADEIRKIQKEEGDKGFIVNVSTIQDFVPKEQDQKIRILHQIEQLLPTRIFVLLSPTERAMVRDLLSSQSFQKFQQTDLPELVRSKFREQNGTIGNLVLVEPSLSPELAKSDNLIHFVHSIREATDKVAPGTAVAGTLPVTSDLFESIVRDGPKATAFAFVAVFLLVILLFRNVSLIAQCSFALLLGVLWLFGFILGFDEKINFLNFIALPITFGIGVDYGVNIFQRYRLEHSKGILEVLRNTGGAVMLASMTTIIGYSSLIIASNQAFVSFGKLAILGELTCVFAAVVSLPAFLWYLEERKRKSDPMMLNTPPNTPNEAPKKHPYTIPRKYRLNPQIEATIWLEWWRSQTWIQKALPAFLALAYVTLIAYLGPVRSDHFLIAGAATFVWYLGPRLRPFFHFLLPLILVGIIYDSQRYYADYIRGPIHVTEPYDFDKYFFGIHTDAGVLTPNEWWQKHTHWILDFICGFFYLTFISIYVFVSMYFCFWLPLRGTPKRSAEFIRAQAFRPMWAFFWVNMIGYSTYYWFAAAPPWYVEAYGLGAADLSVHASPAGAIRFDQLLGTHFFTGMYGRAADVFGAVPSLHVAYPLQAFYYANRYGALKKFTLFFYLIMCFSAVYLNHHYILDILWGSAYAMMVCFGLDWASTTPEKEG